MTQTPTTSIVDRISTAELIKRYGLTSRSSILRWLNGLEIKPHKEGKRFYISRSHLQRLDALAGCLASGKTLSQCLEDRKNDFIHIPVALATRDNLPTEHASFIQLVHEIAAALRPEVNPIDHWFTLERAALANFLLSSLEVKQLIGVRPMGDRFTRGSFTFIKSGKIGSSTAWKVKKL